MPSLSHQILQHVSQAPEGGVLCAKAFLHLGNRAAIDQALSRLVRRGRLLRICHGVYTQPVATRFGLRPPAVEKVIASLSALWQETMVPSGGAAANVLGLTTQIPVQTVYLTSDPNRELAFGELTVHLRHAPRWQLVEPYRPAGDAIRALAWMGPHEVRENVCRLKHRLPPAERTRLMAACAILPSWMAQAVGILMADDQDVFPCPLT